MREACTAWLVLGPGRRLATAAAAATPKALICTMQKDRLGTRICVPMEENGAGLACRRCCDAPAKMDGTRIYTPCFCVGASRDTIATPNKKAAGVGMSETRP